MSNRKDKLIRKTVRQNVNDQYRQLLVSMLGSPLLTRLRYAVIILFRLGYKDLVGGVSGVKSAATG
jgi:hypothetical protein